MIQLEQKKNRLIHIREFKMAMKNVQNKHLKTSSKNKLTLPFEAE